MCLNLKSEKTRALIMLCEDLENSVRGQAYFLKFAKESIMKNQVFVVKRRLRLHVKKRGFTDNTRIGGVACGTYAEVAG